jgi:hypothetical protein
MSSIFNTVQRVQDAVKSEIQSYHRPSSISKIDLQQTADCESSSFPSNEENILKSGLKTA